MVLCLGRLARGRAGDLEGARHAQPRRPRALPWQAAPLPDREAGRHGAVAARLVPEPLRHPFGEELLRHVPRLAGRGPEAGGPRVARHPHPQGARAARRRVPAERMGSWQAGPAGGRHAVVPPPRQRRARTERPGEARPGRLGREVRANRTRRRAHWFDDPAGPQTVSRWRPQVQAEFAERANWMLAPETLASDAAVSAEAGLAAWTGSTTRRSATSARRSTSSRATARREPPTRTSRLQATLWRWRDDFQNDVAARIDWTDQAVTARPSIRPFRILEIPPRSCVALRGVQRLPGRQTRPRAPAC